MLYKCSLNNVVIVLIFTVNIFGQNEVPDLITDRPDVTESAVTVPPGWLQIETGFSISKHEMNDGNTRVRNYNLAGTLLRYGISEFIELRAGGGYNLEKSDAGNRENSLSGFSDAIAGGKIQLTRDMTSSTQVGLMFHVLLPVGEKEFHSETVEPQIIFAVSHDLTERVSLAYNAGGTWNFKDDLSEYILSFAAGISFTEHIGAFGELYAEYSNVNIPAYYFDAGITYLPAGNIQVDTSAGLGIINESSFWFLSTGLSFRIPR